MTRVCCHPDVRLELLLACKGLGEVIGNAGIGRVDDEALACVDRRHVGDDNRQVLSALVGHHGVTGASLRVSWMPMYGQICPAEVDRVSVVESFVDRYGLEHLGTAEVGVAISTIFEDASVGIDGQHPSAGQSLDLRERSGVIPMRLHREKDGYVLHIESE